jgi:hypothetical protein
MRKEVPTGQRKLLNKALHDFQSSPNYSQDEKIKEYQMGGV